MLNTKFKRFGAKIKTSSELLENVYISHFDSTGYESDVGILRFFIQNLKLGKLVRKLKLPWIYLNICTLENLKARKTSMIAIYQDFISKI